MTGSGESEAHILRSWNANAGPWTTAVRERRIESRRLVTDAAIVDAVLAGAPRRVLDIGCGEGWLARALSTRGGVDVLGVDAVEALADQARAAGGGEFRVLGHADLAAGALERRFDTAVCNFSLFGDASVSALLRAMPRLLERDGRLVVQTLHPIVACGDAPYVDGWRAGHWTGFDAAFSDPAPWYFRTLGGWVALIAECGLHLIALHEPIDPRSGRPASLILVATV